MSRFYCDNISLWYAKTLQLEDEVLACIQHCHFQLPEDADWETRRATLDANAPVHWRGDAPHVRRGWRAWKRCRDAYLKLLWPGKPAPELTPADAPL
ncbi:MAG: hypothetical protein OXI83_18985, partial [Gemmatimonadota bacterium]|nr:hypothetical protein [Gemmatimonadota bacterium]